MMEIEGAEIEKLSSAAARRPLWIRWTHWLIVISVLIAMGSGVMILVAHPRLYWGQSGNSLTEPLIELPIGPNYKFSLWEHHRPFAIKPDAITASRTAEPYNQNAWARSLHFLAAWIFTLALIVYLAMAIVTRHLARKMIPSRRELRWAALQADIADRLTFRVRMADDEGTYGLLQKGAYLIVLLFLLPLMILTGFNMSPALAALILPVDLGLQTARTLHFLCFFAIFGFVLIHVAMVMLTGFWRQLRSMIIGR